MVDKLIIQKKNESIMLVGCDFGIAAELSEFFSFFVPGYKFMPAFRNKVWDGKIRLFNAQTHELALGLLPYVKDFCKKRNYEIEYEDGPYGPPENFNNINPKEIMSFIKSLDLRSRDEEIEIRDYQFNAICEGIRRKRAVLLSPTGSGKSLVIYALMRWYLHHYDQKVLIIVPTTSLVRQMYSDFEDYSSADQSWIPNDECHVIYSGQPKININERVFISTWQSIYKLPPTWFEQFGIVFGDECHGFKSKSLTSIMNKSRNASYRFGTTGTLDGTQTHQLVLEGLFGKLLKVTTTKQLQDENTLADLNISMIVFKHSEETRKNFGQLSYRDEIEHLITDKKRNTFIRNLSLKQEGNTLVLFQFVQKHGKVLFDMIESKLKTVEKFSSFLETQKLLIEKQLEKLQKDKKMRSSWPPWELLALVLIYAIFIISYSLVQVSHKLKSYNQSEEDLGNLMTVQPQNYSTLQMTYIGKTEKTIHYYMG